MSEEQAATRTRRRNKHLPDPEFDALIETVTTLLGEWSGPGGRPPHGVAHKDPRTNVLTWHLRGLPEQLDHILAALRAAEPAEVQLARLLVDVADLDPSRHGHAGPDTPEITARYALRNQMIWSALALALELGIPAGVGHDPTDPRPVVVYIDLPGAGQVSWHLPAYPEVWDGHATGEKYGRVAAFAEMIGAETP